MLMLLAIRRDTTEQNKSTKRRGTLGVEVRNIGKGNIGVENRVEPVSKVTSFPRRLIVFALAQILLLLVGYALYGVNVGSHAEYLQVRTEVGKTTAQAIAAIKYGLNLPAEVLVLTSVLWLNLKIAVVEFFWQADVSQEIFRADLVPGAVDFIPVTSKRVDYFFEQILFFKLLHIQMRPADYPLAGWVEFFSVGVEFMRTQPLTYRIQFLTLLLGCSLLALGALFVALKALGIVLVPVVTIALFGYLIILIADFGANLPSE